MENNSKSREVVGIILPLLLIIAIVVLGAVLWNQHQIKQKEDNLQNEIQQEQQQEAQLNAQENRIAEAKKMSIKKQMNDFYGVEISKDKPTKFKGVELTDQNTQTVPVKMYEGNLPESALNKIYFVTAKDTDTKIDLSLYKFGENGKEERTHIKQLDKNTDKQYIIYEVIYTQTDILADLGATYTLDGLTVTYTINNSLKDGSLVVQRQVTDNQNGDTQTVDEEVIYTPVQQ